MVVRYAVVCVRFADRLLLTASVVEDAHRHLNGTTDRFTERSLNLNNIISLGIQQKETDPIAQD